MKASTFSFHIYRSADILIHVAPEKRLISSTYLTFGRRLGRFFSLGIQCSTFVVHLPSVRLAVTSPSPLHLPRTLAYILYLCLCANPFISLPVPPGYS